MTIPLNLGQNGNTSTHKAQAQVMGRDLKAAHKGDWAARDNIVKTMLPLVRQMAEKRAPSPEQVPQYLEAAKDGIRTAIKKYKDADGSRFQMFAIDYVEKAMGRLEGGGGGFFAKLFKRG